MAKPEDAAEIRAVHVAAFPTPAEAELVERICAAGHDELALVAESNGQVVGHILFSPVTVHDSTHSPAHTYGGGLGLAPVAVLPQHAGQGIGSALITAGLEALAAGGCPFVVVLGEPEYYHRFGFGPASAKGLSNQYGVDAPFMVVETTPGALQHVHGLVKYGPEFAGL